MKSFNCHTITLPTDLTATVDIPNNLDPNLAELTVRAVLGGFLALSKCKSAEVRRDFLIRFAASILNDADISVRSVQMANKAEGNPKEIIEDLLKSLHHKDSP
jgi:hypothetical protein